MRRSKVPKMKTGKIRHKDMSSLVNGQGKRDPHASPAFHAANAKHGMTNDMSPQGGYDDQMSSQARAPGDEPASGGMADNCCD